jgi:hypothetical protein
VLDDQHFASVFSSSEGVHWPTSFLEVSGVDLGGCI